MSKKVLAVLFVCMMLLLSACGGAAQAQEENNDEAAGPQDGQNPVMNFVGIYSTEYSTEALVEADGAEGAKPMEWRMPGLR